MSCLCYNAKQSWDFFLMLRSTGEISHIKTVQFPYSPKQFNVIQEFSLTCYLQNCASELFVQLIHVSCTRAKAFQKSFQSKSKENSLSLEMFLACLIFQNFLLVTLLHQQEKSFDTHQGHRNLTSTLKVLKGTQDFLLSA